MPTPGADSRIVRGGRIAGKAGLRRSGGENLTMPRGPNIISGMSIWNKVLVGLNIVAALALCYMMARALRTQQYWEAQVASSSRATQGQTRRQPRPGRGGETYQRQAQRKPGHQARQARTGDAVDRRGRAWHRCVPANIDRQTGSVALNVVEPNPHGITAKMFVYVMSEAEVKDGGRYLGEFQVGQVADQKIQLDPTRKLDEAEINRLVKSDPKLGWSLYEVMPIDKHQAFAGLSEKELKDLLPAASLPEYLKDGQPTDRDAPTVPQREVRAAAARLLDEFRRISAHAVPVWRFIRRRRPRQEVPDGSRRRCQSAERFPEEYRKRDAGRL